MRKVIYTLNVDGYAPEITALTYPLIERWADKIGAGFQIIRDRKFPEWPVTYEKLQIHELGRENDWNIYVDSDALIHPDFFDPTEYLTKDTVLHNGNDVAGNRWRYDRFLRRDGRHIGSCNWFTIASDWCIELWEPLRDLTMEQAIANIQPTVMEQAEQTYDEKGNEVPKQVITADHLIDDYVLSRNIAKYGLHFTTMGEVNKRAQDSGTYLWHQYTLPVSAKVAAMHDVLMKWGLMKAEESKFREAYKQATNHGLLLNVERARNLWNFAGECAKRDGEMWECGVYRGASAYLIGKSAEAHSQERKLIRLFDTFDGFPAKDKDKTPTWVKDGLKAPINYAQRMMKDAGNGEVHFHVGTIPHTFKGLENAKISFAHLDLDLKEGTEASLDFIWPRLVDGGAIMVDDYRDSDWPGIEQAVRERFVPGQIRDLGKPGNGQCIIYKA